MKPQLLRLTVPLPRLLGPGEVVAGEGAITALRALPATRVAVIATGRAAEHPVLARWLSASGNFAVRVVAPSWAGEPRLGDLESTLAALHAFNPDWIVAVGGGSVLDGAKLCWALHEHPHFPRERLGRPFSLPPLRHRCNFAAVPTTAGTGSEASSAAVYVNETGHKVPVVSHEFLPDVAILDPRLVVDLPVRWTVLGALDALGHALEGYVSKLPNPLADPLAEVAVATILGQLDAAVRDPANHAPRLKLQIAAFQAGQVQNLRLVGMAHAVAHQLGAFDIPHAAAIGALLPLTMAYACRDDNVRQAYDRMARGAGLQDAAALIAQIRDLPSRYGLANRLGAYGNQATIGTAEVAIIARTALADPIARFVAPLPDGDAVAGMIAAAW